MLRLVSFNPNPKLSPISNLKKFIKTCRNDLTLWSDQEDFAWESPSWPGHNGRARFTNLANRGMHPSTHPSTDQLMHPTFLEVAKAIIRYRHTIKPHQNTAREFQALRVLEAALIEELGEPDITKLREKHYVKATEKLKDFKARQFICTEMLSMLKLLSEFYIVPAEVVRWQNPYTGKGSYQFQSGARAPAEVKEQKVANQDAFLTIADVFARPISQLGESDIMITSLTALFLSAPMRVGESRRWRHDCFRSEADKNGIDQYYLSYYVPKIGSFTRKPIPITMAPIAEEAVSRLLDITKEGRKLARYMESNPVKFYRHGNCPNIPDDQVLTRDEVAEALGFAHRKACEDFIKKHTGRHALTGFTLNSLWQIVLTEHHRLNPHFPYQDAPRPNVTPLKMSESLLCFRRHQLGDMLTTSPVLLAPFNNDYYAKRLDGAIKKDRKNQRPMCFFTRNGFDPQKLLSHGLRHFVNRLAKQHGVSIEQITEWSSRASVQQTRTYLHETEEQRAKKVAAVMQTAQEHETLQPVTDEEAVRYGEGPFHRSRYGICRRSWRAGPCVKFADCTNCSELLACKGDKIALAAVKADRDNMVKTYQAAQQAIEAGERAASLWMEKATPQIQRLIELVNVLENPDILDGTPIELTGTDFSHEQLMVNEKAEEAGVRLLDTTKLALEYGDDLIDCLKLLMDEI